MNSKKIALIIFLISLIFLSLTAVVYISRQRDGDKNLQTSRLATPPTEPAKNFIKSATSTGLVTKDGQPITEEQIVAKIEAKKKQIKQEAKGRAYNDEELLFIGSPRQAAISDLKVGK